MRKIFLIITIAFVLFGMYLLRPITYPGEAYRGELPPLSQEAMTLKEKLYQHVDTIANKIGERHFLTYEKLQLAASYITAVFKHYGYQTYYDTYRVEVQEFINIVAEVKGVTHPEEIIIVGAHYDTVPMSTGADYNATGVAAILELSRYFQKHPPNYTMRFIAFVNKEVPFIYSRNMGSVRYVKKIHERGEHIVAMYSLEGLGYFSTERYSQRYPYFQGVFRHDVGDFIAFIGDHKSQPLISRSIELFRLHSKFPSEGFASPDFISSINASDHWAFWQKNYPAIMITDTMFYRNKNYSRETDTVKTINFDRFTRVVIGLQNMLVNWRPRQESNLQPTP